MIVRVATHPLKPFSVLRVCELVGSRRIRQKLLQKALMLAKESDLDGVITVGQSTEKGDYLRAGLWLAKRLPVVHDKRFTGPIRVTFFDSDLEHLW